MKIHTFKLILLTIVAIICTGQSKAQNNGGIFFQAVARDVYANPAKFRKIYVQTSIIQNTTTGTIVLSEEHQANTDGSGVFNISIGNGTRIGGTASGLISIDWANGPFYLNIKIAITPLATYTEWNYSKEWVDMGTTSFGVVPYSLYSLTTGGLSQKLNISDSTFKYVTPSMLSSKTFDTTSLSSRINSKVDSNKLGVANGIATLNSSGIISSSQLPPISFTSTSVVSSDSEMTALSSTNIGSIAIRTDVSKSYVLSALPASSLSNWIELLTPASLIQTVNGYTGDVSLTKVDLGLGNAENTSDANKPISTATQAALDLKAPLASPKFTGIVSTEAVNAGTISATNITSPVIASIPINLTYTGSTINWNTALGLNASITLTQNSTLNFTSMPVAGSNGTLLLTQDATGGRTITLPATINNILGSSSTTSIPLSSGAGTKDMLNFYYDGSAFYWNIGLGYGQNVIPVSTNLQTGVTGSLQVSNGGTGGTIFSGLIKGNGTSAMTTAIASVDYQAPITLTTTGVGSATLSGSVLNIPTASSANAGTISGTTLAANVVNSYLTGVGTITSGTWSGTAIAIENGGTGSTNAAGAKTNFGLDNVENTALSTWAGSSNITTVGTLNAAGKTFSLQDLILGYGYNGAKIQTDGSKYISFYPSYGIESTKMWPNGNVTIEHGNINLDRGFTLDVQGTTNFAGNSSITGTLTTTGTVTAGGVIYPNTAGTNGQVLTDDGAGNLAWTTPATVTIGAISGTSTAKGASLTSGVLNLAPADGTNGGIVTNGTQTFGGDKTLNGALSVNGDVTLNNRTVYSLSNIYGEVDGGPTYAVMVSIVDYPSINKKVHIGDRVSNSNNPANTAIIESVSNDGTYWLFGIGPIFWSGNFVDFTNVDNTGAANLTVTGKVTSGGVTYPNTAGTNGQVLTDDGTGNLTWTSPASLTIGAIAGTSTATGASITSGVLNLAPADEFNGGLVTNQAQTFAGDKTFKATQTLNGFLNANQSAGINGALSVNGDVSINNPIAYSLNNITAVIDGGPTFSVIVSMADYPTINNSVHIGDRVTDVNDPTKTAIIQAISNDGTYWLFGIGSNFWQATSVNFTNVANTGSGNLTVGGNVNASNGTMVAKTYKMTVSADIPASATTYIDLSMGNMFKVNLVNDINNLTLNNTNPGTYIIEFIQDGTGNKSVTFPNDWRWSGGITPTITLDANKIDIVTLIYDGSTYFASIVQNF